MPFNGWWILYFHVLYCKIMLQSKAELVLVFERVFNSCELPVGDLCWCRSLSSPSECSCTCLERQIIRATTFQTSAVARVWNAAAHMIWRSGQVQLLSSGYEKGLGEQRSPTDNWLLLKNAFESQGWFYFGLYMELFLFTLDGMKHWFITCISFEEIMLFDSLNNIV